MVCSGLGVAVLEDRWVDEMNPNVALEYGFMRALNKPSLMLVDREFDHLRSDLAGTVYETFDLSDIAGTVGPAISRWLRDLGIDPYRRADLG